MIATELPTQSQIGKPHWRRTQQVYALLNQAPAEATYDRLIEYVRQSTGKGCSRKLISKWKKTVNSHQLPVTSKSIQNNEDEPPKSNGNSSPVIIIPSEQTFVEANPTKPIPETNQIEPEPIPKAKLVERQTNLSIIGDENKQDEDPPKIAHNTSLPMEKELTNNLQHNRYQSKDNSALVTGNWSLFTAIATAILVGLAGCGWFFSKDNSQPVIAQTTTVTQTAPTPRPMKLEPRTIKIDLTLTSPQDLKVKPGDEVTPETVLSDPAGIRGAVRTTERQRLLSQKKQLQLSLKKLDLPIRTITNPEPISKLGKLPPVSYQQEEANIALKQQELDEAEKAITNQQEKIRQLSELLTTTQAQDFNNNLTETEVQSKVKFPQLPTNKSNVALKGNSSNKPILNNSKQANASLKQNSKFPMEIGSNQTIPVVEQKAENKSLKIIIEHEQAILSQLKATRDKAQLQLDIAKSKLITAKEKRAHAEYQRYVEETKRAIAIQQQQIELERQRSIRAGQLQEREYSKSQIEAKIQEIDNAINNLSTVKAPYPGKIKKVKWTGQDNHHLTVQLTLDVDDGS